MRANLEVFRHDDYHVVHMWRHLAMNGKYALTMHNNQKYTLVLYYITDELATYT